MAIEKEKFQLQTERLKKFFFKDDGTKKFESNFEVLAEYSRLKNLIKRDVRPDSPDEPIGANSVLYEAALDDYKFILSSQYSETENDFKRIAKIYSKLKEHANSIEELAVNINKLTEYFSDNSEMLIAIRIAARVRRRELTREESAEVGNNYSVGVYQGFKEIARNLPREIDGKFDTSKLEEKAKNLIPDFVKKGWGSVKDNPEMLFKLLALALAVEELLERYQKNIDEVTLDDLDQLEKTQLKELKKHVEGNGEGGPDDTGDTGIPEETKNIYTQLKRKLDALRTSWESNVNDSFYKRAKEEGKLDSLELAEYRSFYKSLMSLDEYLKNFREDGLLRASVGSLSDDEKEKLRGLIDKVYEGRDILKDREIPELDSLRLNKLHQKLMGEIDIIRGKATETNDDIFTDRVRDWFIMYGLLGELEKIKVMWNLYQAGNTSVLENDLGDMKETQEKIQKALEFVEKMDGDPDPKKRDIDYHRQINALMILMNRLERMIAVVDSNKKSADHTAHEGFTGHEYPFMGDYDTAKRFLIAADKENEIFSYEKVKNWGYNDIAQGLLLYAEDYAAREFYGQNPFMALNALSKHEEAYTYRGDVFKITLGDAIEDLGMGVAQSLHDYAFGAWGKIFKQAHEHQEQRVNGGNFGTVIKTTTLGKSAFLGAFTEEGPTKDPGKEKLIFRAMGIPFTNAAMQRFLVTSIYNRGELGDDDKPTPLKMESGERKAQNTSQKQLTKLMFELIKYARDKHKAKKEGARPPAINRDFEYFLKEMIQVAPDFDESDVVDLSDDMLEKVAATAFIKSLNLSDTLLLRIMADKNHVRFDELDAALYSYFRASVEKYYKESEAGQVGGGGKLKIADIATTAFFEALYQPIIKRTKVRVTYLYRDKDRKIQIGTTKRQLIDVIRDKKIPRVRLVPDEINDEILELALQIRETDDELALPVEEKKQKVLYKRKEIALKRISTICDKYDLNIEAGNQDLAYENGLVVTTLRDLAEGNFNNSEGMYPNSASEDEVGVVNHTTPVYELLTSFSLDFSKLLVMEKRDLTGGEFPTFSLDFAEKIKDIWRQKFYYWKGDYEEAISYREYEELVKNYLPPEKGNLSEKEYRQRYKTWKREWSWRGMPMANWSKDKEGNIDYKKSKFVESSLNQLFNFQIDWDAQERKGMGINKKEAKFYSDTEKSFWMRYLSATDQPEMMQKILTETVIIMNLKNYIRGGGDWDKNHTSALTKALSRETFEANREGMRALILREKTGVGGFTTGPRDREDYIGSGFWTPQEVDRMVTLIIGAWKGRTKTKIGKEK